MEQIRARAEKNEEKMRKARMIVQQRSMEIDQEGNAAFKKDIKSIEERLKLVEEEEKQVEKEKFKSFKNYMTQKEMKYQQIKSSDDLSALRAKEHLAALEHKLKTRK